MDGGTVSRLRGTDEKGILEGPAVHEQLGAPAGGLSVTRPLNESVHPKRTGRVLDRHQSPCQVASPHRSQTLGRLLIRGNRQAAGAIDVELETGLWVGQGEGSNRFVSRPGLAGGGTKKLAAGGSVVKQSANLDRGAPLPRHSSSPGPAVPR